MAKQGKPAGERQTDKAGPHSTGDEYYIFASIPEGMTDSMGHRLGEPRAYAFHCTQGGETARFLCGQFAKVYGQMGEDRSPPPSFECRPAADMDMGERVLIEEAIEDLRFYTSDPDRGVYDPPPSHLIMVLAEYMRRAKAWESLLPAGTGRPGHENASEFAQWLLAGPDNAKLTPSELALLKAYLKQPVRMSAIQQEKRATGRSQTQENRKKLKLILKYNQELRGCEAAPLGGPYRPLRDNAVPLAAEQSEGAKSAGTEGNPSLTEATGAPGTTTQEPLKDPRRTEMLRPKGIGSAGPPQGRRGMKETTLRDIKSCISMAPSAGCGPDQVNAWLFHNRRSVAVCLSRVFQDETAHAVLVEAAGRSWQMASDPSGEPQSLWRALRQAFDEIAAERGDRVALPVGPFARGDFPKWLPAAMVDGTNTVRSLAQHGRSFCDAPLVTPSDLICPFPQPSSPYYAPVREFQRNIPVLRHLAKVEEPAIGDFIAASVIVRLRLMLWLRCLVKSEWTDWTEIDEAYGQLECQLNEVHGLLWTSADADERSWAMALMQVYLAGGRLERSIGLMGYAADWSVCPVDVPYTMDTAPDVFISKSADHMVRLGLPETFIGRRSRLEYCFGESIRHRPDEVLAVVKGGLEWLWAFCDDVVAGVARSQAESTAKGQTMHDDEAGQYSRLLGAFREAFAEWGTSAFVVELDCAAEGGAKLPFNELREALMESYGRGAGGIKHQGCATRTEKGRRPIDRVYVVLFGSGADTAVESLCRLAAEAGATLAAATLAEAGVSTAGAAAPLWWAYVFAVLPTEQTLVFQYEGGSQPMRVIVMPFNASIRVLELLVSSTDRPLKVEAVGAEADTKKRGKTPMTPKRRAECKKHYEDYARFVEKHVEKNGTKRGVRKAFANSKGMGQKESDNMIRSGSPKSSKSKK